ncbi:MAG: hypothetical protein Q9195_006099, partial [Heterodermia aff. obscurata]
CLRALFPTQSPAVYSSDAAFCATFTATVRTQTTGFPSKATAACGTAPARYSSACSCKPTLASTLTSTTSTSSSTSKTSTSTSSTSTTSTSTTSTSSTSSTSSSTTSAGPTCTPKQSFNDAVINGDFECGLPPWVAQDIAGTSHAVTSPGDASNFAYEFDQIGPVSPTANQNPASLSQSLITQGGVPYTLSFRSYFDKCTGSEGFIGVKINGQPVYTVDACDGTAGVFNSNVYQFFAAGGDTLRFEFLIGENPATVKIDNVSVVPLH